MSIEIQYTLRFVLHIIYFLVLVYMLDLSLPSTFKDWRKGSIAVSLMFGTLACYVGALSVVSPLGLFWAHLREVWLPPYLLIVNLTLVVCILTAVWAALLRRNPKMSEYVRLLRLSETDLEKELANARLVSERQERLLEDTRHFLRAVAHDLRAPLRAILGFIELIQQENDQPPNPDYLLQVEYSATRMMRLIDDLSILSRIETEQVNFVRVNLNEVMDEVLQTFQVEAAEKKIAIGPMPTVQGIEQRLTQLFQNLVGNALKFGSTEIEVKAWPHDRDVIVSVRDNGIGIAKPYHAKIFEPFQRLNREEDYEGTGMGLAICQKIVSLHRGNIWVESKPGEGSTFFVRLPRG